MSEPSSTPSASALENLEIHVIPEEFYGAALKTVIDEKRGALPLLPQAPRRPIPRFVIPVGIVAVLGLIGTFVYLNREILFSKPAPVVVVTNTQTPVIPNRPDPPTSLIATSTNAQSVRLEWVNPPPPIMGSKIERAFLGDQTFITITSLPGDSTSFLDVTVQASSTYLYRLRAMNAGGESEPSATATAMVPPLPPPAPSLPPAGLDRDSDGLTDLEELLYGTNPRAPDSDNDGFLDGNEVFHLYNPAAKAPVKLADSGLIHTISASIGWTISTPADWKMTLDDSEGATATIDAGHGERFQLSIEDNSEKKPVLDWYLTKHPTAIPSQVLAYRSKGGYEGIVGSDSLTTYLPWGDRVFVFTYDLRGQPFINFRTTYFMILNSLVLEGLPHLSLPISGVSLPFEPSATSVGVVTPAEPVVSSTEAIPEISATSSMETTSTHP